MVSTKKNKLASLRDPNTLKSGHVKKLSSGKAYVVKRNKEGVARYVKATPSDVKCSKTLKKNVSEMLNEVKSNKNIKSYSQALAIAYSKTQKKYPKCKLVQKNNNKTNKTKKLTNTKYIQNGGKKRVKLQRKIIKLLIEKNYIRKQTGSNSCQPVKGNNIKSLYDDFKSARDEIKKIKYKNKNGKQTVNDFIKLINDLIHTCHSSINVKDEYFNEYFKFRNKQFSLIKNIIPDGKQYEYMYKLSKFIKEKLKQLPN